MGISAERGELKALTSTAVTDDEKLSAYINFKAMPLVSIDTRGEWQSGRTRADVPNLINTNKNGAITVTPKVSHSFAIGGGKTLEPFVNYKRELDVMTSDAAKSAPDSAGAGVTFAKPNAYSWSVTTDVEGIGNTGQQSINSKLQLKLQLP